MARKGFTKEEFEEIATLAEERASGVTINTATFDQATRLLSIRNKAMQAAKKSDAPVTRKPRTKKIDAPPSTVTALNVTA